MAEKATKSYLDNMIQESKVPGVQYLVVAPDRDLFEYSGGWADLANKRPMSLSTTMMAYSMSKTITAAAVLQLVEAKKLDLDESIDRYLEAQPYGAGVSIRELLSHTSGIPNPVPLAWVHPVSRLGSFDEGKALDAVLRKYKRLATPPGTKYAYSNIGYWLLGPIVERISGVAFTIYVEEHILRPLGMAPGELGYQMTGPADHAQGYLEKYSPMNLIKGFFVDRELIGEYAGPWLRINGHYLNGPAFGGLIGTARGFGKFLRDQLREHPMLFSSQTKDLFYEQQRTLQGTAIPMTLGWQIGSTGGTSYYYKEGGGGGFHCMMRLYPSQKVASVVMTNATVFNVRKLLDRLDPAFLM